MSGSFAGGGPVGHIPAERGSTSGLAAPRQTPEAMSGETFQRRVTVTNPQGFHMRPQSVFARLANQFASSVTVSKGDVRANGKSQWELMLLAAEQGTELLLEVSGPDAGVALDALAKVLSAPSADDAAEPPLPKKG